MMFNHMDLIIKVSKTQFLLFFFFFPRVVEILKGKQTSRMNHWEFCVSKKNCKYNLGW